MRQKELLDSIKKYFSRFDTQVKISNANNEYDINIHSENVIIPILNLVYKLNLKNANYSEEKNTVAIDLIDEEKKVAVQVTSTKELSKIKNTIAKFLNSKYKNKILTLYVYILGERQQNYSQLVINKITKGKTPFNTKEHIICSSDLYLKLVELNDLNIIEEIENILKNQFSDIYLNGAFTLSNLTEFKNKYKQSCIANFSRINFFGLSVSTNKPREIELYKLFVSPTFRSNSFGTSFSMPKFFPELILAQKDKKYYEPITFKATEPLSVEFTQRTIENIDKQIIRIKDSDSIRYFEVFHERLQENQKIQFNSLFVGSSHKVVIGRPGAGKSSFIKYSICKILENDTGVFLNDEIYSHIPFRIELHKYNGFKKAKSGGLIEYLSNLLLSEYQQNITIENLTSILKVYPSLFFFDGLDEIFDIQERIQIRNDIESFVKLYSNLRSIVTSRYESYEEVSLSEKIYLKLELLDFDDNQVEDYVKKWYAIEESNPQIRDRESTNCLAQLKGIVSELKHNPLLLSLILLLYRNELDIPTSKLSIYESCTTTIVDTRDVKEKKLNINIKIINKLSIFASLAFWQFNNETQSKNPPSFDTICLFIKNYLIEKGEFIDDYLSQQATTEFLNFAKLRSIYFENKFTHKTFLEYFTAYYIYSFYYSNYRKAQEFYTFLIENIGLSTWSVVLELLICKIDSTQINFEVIDDLFEKLYSKSNIDTLIFFLQILKYLRNISPKRIKFVIDKSIFFSFKDGEITKESKVDYQELLFTYLCSLGEIERFKEIIENSFSDFISQDSVDKNCINAFVYEFAIASGNVSLVSILRNKNLDSNSEYIFILNHYPNLFDNVKYLETLRSFTLEFPTAKLSNIYESPFRQKIFFNSEKFNWVLTYISINFTKEKLYPAYQELLGIGISKEKIYECSKRKSAIMNFDNLETTDIDEGKNDMSFIKFITSLKLTYTKTVNKKQRRLLEKISFIR